MHAEKITQGFFTGINYWGSAQAINLWDPYDAASVDADFRVLKEAGITHLRVFPLWPVFQPLTALYTTSGVPYEYRFGEEPLPDTPAGRAGVSEEACAHFENFCGLALRHGLKLVVGLITGHMSFREYAPPAFAGRHRLSDPTVLKWQLRFVRYFVRRFRDQSCIVGWDLGNEVNNMAHGQDFSPDDFYVWCSAIADAIRAADGTRPVISGMDAFSPDAAPANLMAVGETCDVHTCHPYNIFATASDPLPTMKPLLDLAFKCRLYEDVAKTPTFVQEFGAIGYTNCSRKTEADFYRAALYTALSHDCHGVMWWCAFDQGHLRFAPYDWNNIGSDYGFFDRSRRPKPLVEENLRFQDVLRRLPGGCLPPHATQGVILIPRDNGDAEPDKLRAAFLLGKRANLDFRFHYALDALPDAPLYLLPSLNSNQPLPARRLDALLRRVEEGAVLYLSLGSCLFRQLPEIAGVDIAWRACISREATLHLGDAALPVSAPVQYAVENCRAEILGRDEMGTPVFFKNQYGKGVIYCLLMPLEQSLARRPGAFWQEHEPPYETVYREIARAAGADRVVDSDSPFLRLTEHPVDEATRYVVAVNYSQKPRQAHMTVRSGRLTPVCGAEIRDGVLSLREDDGAIFLYEREETEK